MPSYVHTDYKTHVITGTPQNDIDWRSSGKVSAVKNQGSCGGCYAFSAIAAYESARAIKYGELVSYSEQ